MLPCIGNVVAATPQVLRPAPYACSWKPAVTSNRRYAHARTVRIPDWQCAGRTAFCQFSLRRKSQLAHRDCRSSRTWPRESGGKANVVTLRPVSWPWMPFLSRGFRRNTWLCSCAQQLARQVSTTPHTTKLLLRFATTAQLQSRRDLTVVWGCRERCLAT